MAKKGKARLDQTLLDRGLSEDLKSALAMVMAGLVKINGHTVTKPGTPVAPDDAVELKERNPYVSRGGLKLEAALRRFGISVAGKVCMDIGASTGGFTDCLLQHGAARVYAVDVGRNQLHYRLRNDPRIENIENVNFRYFSRQSLNEDIEFVTIDVSFISLEVILPRVMQFLAPGGEILALVKPQFEAAPSEAKSGVVRDEAVRLRTVERIKRFAEDSRLETIGSMDCPVKGPKGNVEHFLWLRRS